MTEAEELEFNKNRDANYLNAATPVYNGSAKDFSRGYQDIQHLYDGTSFQKKYYPKQYQQYIETLKMKKS